MVFCLSLSKTKIFTEVEKLNLVPFRQPKQNQESSTEFLKQIIFSGQWAMKQKIKFTHNNKDNKKYKHCSGICLPSLPPSVTGYEDFRLLRKSSVTEGFFLLVFVFNVSLNKISTFLVLYGS